MSMDFHDVATGVAMAAGAGTNPVPHSWGMPVPAVWFFQQGGVS